MEKHLCWIEYPTDDAEEITEELFRRMALEQGSLSWTREPTEEEIKDTVQKIKGTVLNNGKTMEDVADLVKRGDNYVWLDYMPYLVRTHVEYILNRLQEELDVS